MPWCFFSSFFFLFISSSLVWRARERAVGLNFYRHIPFISIFIICFVYEHFFRSYALICYTQPKIKLEGKTKYIRLILSKLNKLFIILSSSNNHVWIFVYTLFCICFFVPHNIFCCCFSFLLFFLFVYVFCCCCCRVDCIILASLELHPVGIPLWLWITAGLAVLGTNKQNNRLEQFELGVNQKLMTIRIV